MILKSTFETMGVRARLNVNGIVSFYGQECYTYVDTHRVG